MMVKPPSKRVTNSRIRPDHRGPQTNEKSLYRLPSECYTPPHLNEVTSISWVPLCNVRKMLWLLQRQPLFSLHSILRHARLEVVKRCLTRRPQSKCDTGYLISQPLASNVVQYL